MDQLKKLKLDPDYINNGLSDLNTTQVKEKVAVTQLLDVLKSVLKTLRKLIPA